MTMMNHDNRLLQILGDGRFHSGEELGAELQVSRTAIWKQIRKLKKLGLEIDSVSGRGYCLAHGIRLLDRSQITAALSPATRNAIDVMDIYLSIDSTNSEAMRRVQRGDSGIQLILAEQQLAGRGRRGRQWLSPMARNLYLSLIWSFEHGVQALEGLSLVTALSLVRALQSAGISGLDGLQVKWPNDVWLRHHKLAGILLELQGDAQGPLQVVIGIGLNVNLPQSLRAQIQQPVTDLSNGGSEAVDRNLLVAKVVSQLHADLQLFAREGFAVFQAGWQSLDVFHGQRVEVTRGRDTLIGEVAGVSESGALLLQTPQGRQVITGGEVLPSVRALG